MTVVIRRSTLNTAEEIFNALGAAFQEIQIYTEEHPRFQESCTEISRLIQDCFSKNREFSNLTFTVGQGNVLFQGIPLPNLLAGGKKLIDILKTLGTGGLQFRPGIDVDGVRAMLKDLHEHSRLARLDNQSKLASAPGTQDQFLFLSGALVRDLELERGGGRLDELESILQGGIGALPELRVSEGNIRSFLRSYRSVLSRLEDGKAFDYSSVTRTATDAMTLFSTNPEVAIQSATESYFDDFTFQHSLNVCLLTTTAAARLVRDATKLNQISVAALLHDVGKSQVPGEILYKTTKLSAAEFECLKTHSEIGAEILLGIDGIDPICVAVAFGHHMHTGRGSYPRTELDYRCDWVTEMISVVDVYEALTAIRPYKRGLSTRKAFEIMLKMPGLQKKLGFVRLLYDCIGPYPVGAAVELSSGERAIVVRKSKKDPNLPTVKIIADAAKNPISEPIEVDLQKEAKQQGKARRVLRSIVLQHRDEDPAVVEATDDPVHILGEPATDDSSLMRREG